MVSWAEVREWTPASLSAAEADLTAARDRLMRAADDMDRMGTPSRWHGTAAEKARGECKRIITAAEDLAGEVSAARRAVIDAVDQVPAIQRAVEDALGYASAHELSIGSDGGVTDVAPLPQVPNTAAAVSGQPATVASGPGPERALFLGHCAQLVAHAITLAEKLDHELDRVMSRLAEGWEPDHPSSMSDAAHQGDLAGSLIAVGPAQHTPAEVADWWSRLSADEQAWVLSHHPEWLGNRDGIPFSTRDQANHALIPIYRRQLEERLAALRATRREQVPYDPYSGRAMHGAVDPEELGELEDKLASLKEIEHLAAQPDHHIIGLDLIHERAQAIVSQGDLDTAKYTSVFTPGLTSTVQGMRGNDDDMLALRAHSARDLRDAMTPAQIEAAGGYAQALAQAKDQVATVTWLDYQAPQISTDSLLSANSVASSHTAKVGGAALADFYRGLDQSRAHSGHGDPHVLAISHSFGTTVQGYAAQHHHTGIDTAYFSESPGMGVDSASELDIPRGQVFYSEGDNDPVADARQFGVDPSTMPGVEHLETRDAVNPETGVPLHQVTKHNFSPYTDVTSTSGYNLAKLQVDQQQNLIYGNDTNLLDHVKLRDHLDNPLIVLAGPLGPGLYVLNKGFEVLGR